MSFTLNRLTSDLNDTSVILAAFSVTLLAVCSVSLLYFEGSSIVFPSASIVLIITQDNPQTLMSTWERRR